ncbi:D-serine deaminase-like pyridoxal phosphate-dependent protein [Micromonospora kangleipakensis]|uniref:D-serine deaminase-like pyridoxal phosphate-dependent protein n=1 Tax=Micromonospora kangleipakensis TaxID=1077942 RepID=A0A4Q8B5H1_9ACTN|nr:alanine racemase [Micromonospora kangleipakensis]RZU72832.1 D-serine deaminase-like pyridoxal phosphate-dependent protein [Micromonospora kangleipakensis]
MITLMHVAAPLPADVSTPYLAVDLDVLDRNLRMMAASAAARGLALRPHAKTHKCLQVARRQMESGAVGLTVATISEAEVFAEAGFTDLFIAYPVWASSARARRLRALAEQVSLRVGVDSTEGARLLADAVRKTDVEVLVEIDSGHHRSGVQPRSAGEVAATAARHGLQVCGVFTFPGHGYGPGRRDKAAADEAEALEQAAAALDAAGVDARVRSGGSTPTASVADPGTLTEIRPGVYAFGDAQQVELGSCAWPDVALTAAATIVSKSGQRIILDAGSKVLGADQPTWATGGGRLPDYPHAHITALSEHHATAVFPEDRPAPRHGEIVRVAPNHVCSAVNLADELVIVSGGREVDRWAVAARGANT